MLSARDLSTSVGDANSPLQPKCKFLGIDMKIDSANWHWMMVFPLITKDTKEEYDQPMEDAQDQAKTFFTALTKEVFGHIYEGFKDGMSKREFHQLCRDLITEVLRSNRNGLELGQATSVDGDEIFLLIELTSLKTMMKLADRQEVRQAVNPEAYETADKRNSVDPPRTCPTLDYSGGFVAEAKQCPMHIRYDIKIAQEMKVYHPFTELDCIRMLWRRFGEFFSIADLEAAGVVTCTTPVHKYEALDYFWKTGWTDLRPTTTGVLQFPDARHADDVKNYFGEEVAFFFHWLNFYTKWLILPAALGLLLFWRRWLFDVHMQACLQFFFAVIMVFWSTLFCASYQQRSSLKCQQWGMKNFNTIAAARKEYIIGRKGTWIEWMWRSGHWLLAVAFMLENIVAVYWINNFRKQAARLPEGETMYGMSGKMAAKVGLYMVTLNIKGVGAIWAQLSPRWSMYYDNWRTDQELKAAIVRTGFPVKFVIYYYPFFYYAFLMEPIEGCHPNPSSCMDTLVMNLAVFFVTHIGCVVAFIILSMLMYQWKVRRELRKVKDGEYYTYLQAQAKMDVYQDDTDDFMELALSWGFLAMFGVALPVTCTIAFLCNLFEIRLLAFRMMYVMRRPSPKGAEGIGAWQDILETLATVACVVNVGLAVFAMEPIKLLPTQTKMIIFVVAEHGMLALSGIVARRVPKTSVAEDNIIDIDDEMVDDILGDVSKPISVKEGRLQLTGTCGFETDDQGKVTSVETRRRHQIREGWTLKSIEERPFSQETLEEYSRESYPFEYELCFEIDEIPPHVRAVKAELPMDPSAD